MPKFSIDLQGRLRALQFLGITFIIATMEGGYYFLLPYLQGRGVQIGSMGGLMMGICYAGSILGKPIVPIIENIFGLKKLIYTGLIFFLASSLGIAFAISSPALILFWRVLTGFGLSLVGISLMTYQTQIISEHVRGRDFAFIATAYNLPPLTLMPLLEYCLNRGHYMTYALIFPVIVLTGIYITYKLPDISESRKEAAALEKSAENEASPPSYKQIFTSPVLILFMLSVAAFALSDAGQLTFVLLAKEKGVAASWFFASASAIALLLRTVGGSILDKVPRKIFACVTACITTAGILLATVSSTPLHFILIGLFYGVGMGLGFPAFMCLIGDLGKNGLQSRLMVLFGFIYSACYFIGPTVTEYVINITGAVTAYRITFTALLLFALAVTYFNLRLHKVPIGNLTKYKIFSISERGKRK